jgi:hypothetical protein
LKPLKICSHIGLRRDEAKNSGFTQLHSAYVEPNEDQIPNYPHRRSRAWLPRPPGTEHTAAGACGSQGAQALVVGMEVAAAGFVGMVAAAAGCARSRLPGCTGSWLPDARGRCCWGTCGRGRRRDALVRRFVVALIQASRKRSYHGTREKKDAVREETG